MPKTNSIRSAVSIDLRFVTDTDTDRQTDTGPWLVAEVRGQPNLHMAQLMPLPLTVSCFSKIQSGFTFLVPAHPGSPGQRAVKRVCMCVCVPAYLILHTKQRNNKFISFVASVCAAGRPSVLTATHINTQRRVG